jgi:hypothetical protein
MLVQYDTQIDIKKLKKQILKNELKIIKKYPPTGYGNILTDGNTGLGLNSLTARHYHFNVLNWWGTKTLKKEIKRCCLDYINQTNQPVYIQCWANVMRNGDKIHPHNHRPRNDFFKYHAVSGNLFISCDKKTNTYYENIKVSNVVGKLILFPSHITHWTDTYYGKEERISIAFDVRTKFDWEDDVYSDAKKHWIKI